MPERFLKPAQRDLEDNGIRDPSEWRTAFDFREEVLQEAKIEREKKASDIVDAFYAEGFLQLDTSDSDESASKLKERLNQFPEGERNEIFRQWCKRYPRDFFWRAHIFDTFTFPESFQSDVVGYIVDEEPYDESFYSLILRMFPKITNRELSALIVNHPNVSLRTLAENRAKLPHVTEAQIIAKADHMKGTSFLRYIDWAEVIPYVDTLPSLDKAEVVEGVFQQSNNRDVGVLLKYREKLGISTEELLEMFYIHNSFGDLAGNVEHVDPAYHQDIVDTIMGAGYPRMILENASKFKQINVPGLLRTIFADVSESKTQANGKDLLCGHLSYFAEAWGREIPEDILENILENSPDVVARYIDSFGERIRKEDLIEKLLEKKQFQALISNRNKLLLEANEDLATKIIQSGGAEAVLKNFDAFKKLSRAVYISLLEAEPLNTMRVYLLINKFEGITKDDVYQALRTIPKNQEGITEICSNHEKFVGLRMDAEFVNILVENSHFKSLIYNLEKFEGIDRVDMARRALEDGQVFCVIQCMYKFPSSYHQEFAEKAIEKEQGIQVISHFKNFQGLDHRKTVLALIAAGESYAVATHFDLFEGVNADRSIGQEIFNKCLAMPWNAAHLINFSEAYKPPLDRTLTLASNIFGEYVTQPTYQMVRELLDGSISQGNLRFLGITRSGDAGVSQLYERMARFKSEILESSFDAKKVQESDFYAQYYKAYVRFSESEWGDEEESFEDMLENFIRQQENNDNQARSLPVEYQPSGELRIDKVDKQLQESFQYSEQFLSRYETLRRSLEDALDLFDEKKPLSHVTEILENKREGIIADLQGRLQALTHQKAIDNLSQRIETLKALDFRSVKNFQDNFAFLAQFGDFDDELRQLVFYYALHKNKNHRETIRHLVEKESPSFKEISSMINFIGHIVNEETWNTYFTDRQAVKAFNGLTSPRALEEEYTRAQNQGIKGTAVFDFIPTRGLLMEFSGHIADACWASKYQSIAKEFPNFSAIIMVQNKGTKYERVAGAAMVIETRAEDGTPLLVIRGLNPLQNVINSLSTEDFVKKFTAYVREIAKKGGRKLAIVIDDHSGGSSTNRPILFSYLESQKAVLRRVALESETDTKFNGYNITDNTYLL